MDKCFKISCRWGNVELIKLILDYHERNNKYYIDFYGGLEYACRMDNIDAVKYLINKFTDFDFSKCLKYAINYSAKNVVELLRSTFREHGPM